MRVVAALDSFKGSVSSREAGEAVRRGVVRIDPSAEVVVCPIADGGEGTIEAVLATSPEAYEVAVDTVDLLGRPISAAYAVIPSAGGSTAVVEAARIVGLGLLGRVDATAPARAHSAGLAPVLQDALGAADRVLLGLGGTGTTDGGTGLVLGWDRVDGLAGAGNPLWDLVGYDGPLPDFSRVEVLTDVSNPLCGPGGAAQVFAPQKGATAEQVAHLDAQLRVWADELTRRTGRDVASAPGAGAAGGLGAALLAGGADLTPGFTRLADVTGLATLLVGADLVFSGEGSLDAQTAMGKGPAGVAHLARAAGAVVVGLAGRVERPGPGAYWPFDMTLPIHSRIRPLAEAMDPAVTCAELSAAAAEVVSLLAAARRRRSDIAPAASPG